MRVPRLPIRLAPGRRSGARLLVGAVTALVLGVPLVAPSAVSATPPAARPAAAPAAAAAPAPSAAQLLAAVRKHTVRHRVAGRTGPFGPNPATSIVPRADMRDWGGWKRVTSGRDAAPRSKRTDAQERAAKAAAGVQSPRYVREEEPAGTRGANDTFGTSQWMTTFGTRAGLDRAVTILGRLSPAPVSRVDTLPPNREDDGEPARARDTGVSNVRGGFRTTGVIGDAPARPGNPDPDDMDFYKLTLRAGDVVDATVRRRTGNLEPAAALVDAKFNIIGMSRDDGTTATLATNVRTGGTYYLVTLGYTIYDPTKGKGVRSEGGYDITATARAGDRDLYAVWLLAGDVLGASVTDAAAYVSVFDYRGVEVHGSPQDASFVYPTNSPLPGGGNAVTDHVARTTGMHFVEVTAGSGPYTAELELYRFGGAAAKTRQTVYLDFDGQRLNTNIFGGRGVTTLSPMRAFLGRWGMSQAQERALAERIKTSVREDLEADLRASGISPWVDVEVVTSFDGPDRFGEAGVTRVIVGGTIPESGVPTIGIAQSIDPGNMVREESALVLLDAMSEPGDRRARPYSLNSYLTTRSDRVAFVGRAVGTVVAHEVGHLIGNWHVDEENSTANVMDAGGNFAQMFGVGRDGIGGTADDVDVDFGVDRFNTWEGFTGLEDTLSRSAWGLSTAP